MIRQGAAMFCVIATYTNGESPWKFRWVEGETLQLIYDQACSQLADGDLRGYSLSAITNEATGADLWRRDEAS
jgi:hypothetical protein